MLRVRDDVTLQGPDVSVAPIEHGIDAETHDDPDASRP